MDEPAHLVLAERIASLDRRVDERLIALDLRLNERMHAINKALELAQNNHRSALTAWIAVVLALLSTALSLYKHG